MAEGFKGTWARGGAAGREGGQWGRRGLAGKLGRPRARLRVGGTGLWREGDKVRVEASVHHSEDNASNRLMAQTALPSAAQHHILPRPPAPAMAHRTPRPQPPLGSPARLSVLATCLSPLLLQAASLRHPRPRHLPPLQLCLQ